MHDESVTPDSPEHPEHPENPAQLDQAGGRRHVAWDVVMAVLAIASLVPVLWVELAQLHWGDPLFQTLAAIDLVLVVIFAGDLAVSVWRAPRRWAYLWHRWYELPGLVPLYFEAVALLRFAQVLRLTRLLRLLRAVKTLRHTRSLQVLDVLINRNKLLHTALVTVAVVGLLATVVWLLERDTNEGLAHFSDALWWAVVTTTTVGYGDITPQTGMARVVATGLMLTGIGLIAVLASSFSSALIATDVEKQPGGGSDLAGQLERLAALRERGHLSDPEFAAAKRKLLA